jgi:DNA-binding GntR family transcriptional regulator
VPTLKTFARPLPFEKMTYEILRDSILNGELRSGEFMMKWPLRRQHREGL